MPIVYQDWIFTSRKEKGEKMDLYSTYQLLSILRNYGKSTGINQNAGLYGTAVGSSAQGISFWETMQNVSAENRGSQSRSLGVPSSMDGIFEEAARNYGVDVNLLKAIGKAESDFNPSCTSSAGAMGVMQLMPCNVEELGISDPYDVRENIMGGAKHFADMLEKYHGNVELALAGYNAGSGNVAKYGGIPPFKETQNYIKKVLSYAKEPISTGRMTEDTGLSQGTADVSYANTDLGTDYFRYLVEMSRLEMQMRMSSMMTQAMNSSEGGSFLL